MGNKEDSHAKEVYRSFERLRNVAELNQVVKRLNGSSQKVKRAQILLKSDSMDQLGTDARIADAFNCRTQTIEKLRQRLVESGFRETLDGKQRSAPPTPKILDGEQEARIIATRLARRRKAMQTGRFRLLARKVVELEIVDSVSYATLSRTLKKTA